MASACYHVLLLSVFVRFLGIDLDGWGLIWMVNDCQFVLLIVVLIVC